MTKAESYFGGTNTSDNTASVRQAQDKVNRAKSRTHSENTGVSYRKGMTSTNVGRPRGKVRKNPGA